MLTVFNNFPARDYLKALNASSYNNLDIVFIGEPETEVSQLDLLRTNGLWKPEPMSKLIEDKNITWFNKKSDKLIAFLKARKYDIIIPLGVGIIKKNVLDVAEIGCLNIHPGKIPEYKGCSCPEWQIFEMGEFWATAHFMDKGIDTGPILLSKKFNIDEVFDYHVFRSRIYEYCASLLIECLSYIDMNKTIIEKILITQKPEDGTYRKPMIKEVKSVKNWFTKKNR